MIGFRWRNDNNTGASPGFVIDDILIKDIVPVTYTWSGGPIVSGGSTLTPTVNPTATTIYTLTANLNGCKATDDVEVRINTEGNPSFFGENIWNVYAYNGNDTDFSLNTYRGFYIQPDLGNGNFGVSTTKFWANGSSPSNAGEPQNSRSLWRGCPVDDDIHSYSQKRIGFPCGNYTFDMKGWDDETRILIDGVSVWSCGVWSGNTGGYSNSNSSLFSCTNELSFTYQLDADSKVEIQTFEGGGGSNATIDIKKIDATKISTASNSSRECRVNGIVWIDFVDDRDEIIASINPNGQDLGDVRMVQYSNSLSAVMNACNTSNSLYQTAYMERRWIMTSSFYPSGQDFPNDVFVRLPYTKDELIELNNMATTVTTGNPLDGGNMNPATSSNLMLTKITGGMEDGGANASDCSGTIRGINSSGNGNNFYSFLNTEYVVFNIGQFSEFFLHKNNEGSALPVKLTNFSASCDDIVSINWTTATEQNSDYFVLEKSRDGESWFYVESQQAAGNSNSTINYRLSDENNWNSVTYYRLKQVDFDGKEEIYGPISVLCDGDKSNMKIYPNPNNGTFTIEVSSGESYSDVQLLLTDITGKIVTSKKVDISNGTTQVLMNDLDLRKGSYLVWLKGTDVALKPIKVIVSQ